MLGANRLNNGAGGQVSLIALGGILVLAFLLLRWRHQLRDETICVAIYFLSLALLLMTSLRGWYVTGHDIQTEYLVFQLTYSHAHWNIGSLSSAYNACLSITILPTELAQVTHVFHPYVFKVFFQLMFAVCPVLGYTIARRYYPKWVSIMAVVYFVGFPTFFTDMPYLNRQEMAFLFACSGILAMGHRQWGVRRRRFMLIAACLGIELSHYSTMYVFLGAITVAWLAGKVSRWIGWRWPGTAGIEPTRAGERAQEPRAAVAGTLSIGVILAVVVIVISWGGGATRTTGGATGAARAVASSLTGRTAGVRSGDVAYGLLPGSGPSAQSLLNSYRRQTMRQRSGPDYLPTALVERYRTPAVAASPAMPLTAAGRLLAAAGIPVAGLNAAIRQAAAGGEQLFALVGLAALLFARRGRRRVGGEHLCLCLGSIAMVALITVLPDLSADYGVLRSFQEALLVIGPVLVAGSRLVFRPLGETRAIQAAVAVGLILFTNERFRYLLDHGQTRALDGVRHADADGPRLRPRRARSARSGSRASPSTRVDDMETLFDGIPLDKVTTSMTINAPAAILLAFYVVAAEEQGIAPERLGGTIQTDILKEYIAQKEWCFPIEPAMRLVTDMVEWCTDADAALAPDLDLRLPHPRGRLDRPAGARVHAQGRLHLRRAGDRARPRRRRLRAAAELLLQRPHRLLRGDRQVPRRAPHLGPRDARHLRRAATESRCGCASTRRRPASR